MLRTFTEFMRIVNAHIEMAEWWENVAEKYCEYGTAKYSECVDNGRQQRIAVLDLCEKYPIFGTLYNLNKARKRA